MVELNNSIFYKVKFNITSTQGEDDLIWSVIYHIKTWLLRKYNKKTSVLPTQNATWSRLKKGGTLSSFDKRTIFIEAEAFEESVDMVFWAARISEKQQPKAGFAQREWITEVGIKPIEKGCVEFSCVISYLDRPGFIGICEDEPFPNIPNLIKYILQDSNLICSLGGDKISILPQILHSGDWVTFWENIQSKERLLPYIFISVRDNGSDCSSISIDPQNLAIAAGGNAIVFYANETSIMEEMNRYCPDEYRCYGGAIRIYQPYVDITDPLDNRRHRYIGTRMIAQLGQDKIVQMIRRALAQDIHFYETFFRIKDCHLKQEAHLRQLRLAELKKQHQEESLQITREKEREAKNWFDMALHEEENRLHAEDELAKIRTELQNMKEVNFRLTNEIDTYRQLAARNAELERACNNRLNTKSYPQTPTDIVNYFDATFGDCIAFSEDVERSIKACNVSSEELWKVFYYLSTTMRELYMSGSGDIYKEFKNRTGITIGRGEGANTHKNKKLMKQYETEYHGIKIDIEAHVKCSRNYQRIHFGFCAEDRKVVVGWCGEHKDNATTQRVR